MSNHKERDVLPKDIVPVHYFVSLTPDLAKHFRFLGRVEIDLLVKESSDFITLNTLDLCFFQIQLKDGDDIINIKPTDVVYDPKKQQTRIPLPKKLLSKATPQLCIDYCGVLSDNMKGFYRSKYQRSNGETAYCGVTQFQATDARRAFPCWDEPSAKATFALELTVPNDLVCLSNMSEKKVTEAGSMKTVLFETTPLMSTYLVAWFIGEFEYVESKTSRGIQVRVWTAVGKKEDATFACQTGSRCLDFYEKYFEIDYPLPKCDMVAVPDFSLGAMENWGLVMYREVALLANKSGTTVRQLRYVAMIVCHELSHQWFGNLVTMEWWAQLWLNEGFACFMQYFGTFALFPDWPMWNLFVTNEYSRAFELDGMVTSHAIEVDVQTSGEAEEMFDAISYCKGASVIRMLQGYIGDKVFRQGLIKYLNNFRYSNAVTSDLWDYLSKEKDAPIGKIMNNWIKQQGFPLLTATRNGHILTLKQTRYLSSDISTAKQEKVVWTIPLQLRIGDKIVSVLMDKETYTVELPKNAEWVHLNADSIGFYASQYDKEMMDSLTQALKKGEKHLSTLDKVCLVRDALAVAECGIPGETLHLLNLIVSFQNNDSHAVWDTVLTAAQKISHIIDGDKNIAPNFNQIMCNVLLPTFQKVGWPSQDKKEDEDVEGLLRPLILYAMGKYEFQPVIDESLKRFTAFMNDEKDDEKKIHIPSSLRSVIFSIAVKYGGKKEFEMLKNYYLTTTDSSEKDWALRSLGLTRDPELIQHMLQWIKDSNDVRNQDKVFPFRTIASNPAGKHIAWEFLQKTFSEWYAIFEGGFLVKHLAKLPSEFVSFEKATEIEKFFDSLDFPACKRSMQQCVENIRKNASWRKQDLPLIEKWVNSHVNKEKS